MPYQADAVVHYIPSLSFSLSLSLLSHTQWQEGGREDTIMAIMPKMESGRKKGGPLSIKLNLVHYKEFNLWLVLLSEPSVHNHPYLWMLYNNYAHSYCLKVINNVTLIYCSCTFIEQLKGTAWQILTAEHNSKFELTGSFIKLSTFQIIKCLAAF